MLTEPTSPANQQRTEPPTVHEYEQYFAAKQVWLNHNRLLRRVANEDARTMAFAIRQWYKWGPRNPDYLALTDIELKLEYYRIRAFRNLERHGETPDEEPPIDAESEEIDDALELLDSGLVDEADFWDTVTKNAPIPPE